MSKSDEDLILERLRELPEEPVPPAAMQRWRRALDAAAEAAPQPPAPSGLRFAMAAAVMLTAGLGVAFLAFRHEAGPAQGPTAPLVELRVERGLQWHLLDLEAQLAAASELPAPERASTLQRLAQQNRLQAAVAERAGGGREARVLRAFTVAMEGMAAEPNPNGDFKGALAQLNFEVKVMQARLASHPHRPASATCRRFEKENVMKTSIASLLALALLVPCAYAADSEEPVTVLVAADSSRKEARRAPTEEEALALAALEGLMSMPPERALPILKRVLAGNQSNLVKSRALFVVSQIDTADAQKLLIDVAKQRDHPLRLEAIRNIGIGGESASLAVLKEVYANGDEATRKHVLEAWLIADRRAEVYQVALAAKSEAEADRAIATLAAMGAKDELRKLAAERKTSKNLMEALAVAGDLQSLKRIAETSPDPAMRAEAVRRMGIVESPEAKKVLREMYTSATDPKIKAAALDGLLIADDQQSVLEIYKAAKTPEEKRNVLRILSAMGGDAALAAIDAALEGKK
jgi:hypothetical protein